MTDQQNLANAIRALSMDAVQRAGCGHPGLPMGMADIAQVLWTKHIKYNPSNLIGLIEIGLFYPTDMVPCFFIHFFI